ncbi:MAG: hypothetical protein AAF849_05905 [Bacteroidota bacterium]
MNTLVVKVKEDKRDFLLQLLHALDFVEVESEELSETEQIYIEAIAESEADIEAGNTMPHQAVKEVIKSW